MVRRSLLRANVSAARRLRAEATPSEKALWASLRNHRLEGWQWRRQHPVGAFVLDFYCPRARLAVEIDGLVHEAPVQTRRDQDRQHILEEMGIRFLRIPARVVETDIESALELISRALASLREGDTV